MCLSLYPHSSTKRRVTMSHEWKICKVTLGIVKPKSCDTSVRLSVNVNGEDRKCVCVWEKHNRWSDGTKPDSQKDSQVPNRQRWTPHCVAFTDAVWWGQVGVPPWKKIQFWCRPIGKHKSEVDWLLTPPCFHCLFFCYPQPYNISEMFLSKGIFWSTRDFYKNNVTLMKQSCSHQDRHTISLI